MNILENTRVYYYNNEAIHKFCKRLGIGRATYYRFKDKEKVPKLMELSAQYLKQTTPYKIELKLVKGA